MGTDRRHDRLARDYAYALVAALGHRGQQGSLGSQQTPRRVAQLVAAVGQRQRQRHAETAGTPYVRFQRHDLPLRQPAVSDAHDAVGGFALLVDSGPVLDDVAAREG